MLLRDNLYFIVNSTINAARDEATYTVHFNAEADIYKAHFPGHPVTPGVCIMQMIVEVLNDLLNNDYCIEEVKNIKYLQIIDPSITTEADIQLSDIKHIAPDTVTLKATVFRGGVTFTKASLTCKL